jgi:hypothetical protein
MGADQAARLRVKVAGLVLTPHLKQLKDWLERLFGFTATVDWVQSDWSAGKVYCRRNDEEILLVGCDTESGGVYPATIVLLVNDIDTFASELAADGMEFLIMRDVGERPTIEFDPPSPYHMFLIQEMD